MYRMVDEQAAFLVIDKAPGTHVHRDGEATGLMDRLRDDTGCEYAASWCTGWMQ